VENKGDQEPFPATGSTWASAGVLADHGDEFATKIRDTPKIVAPAAGFVRPYAFPALTWQSIDQSSYEQRALEYSHGS
jgi:hypothetical protein